MKPLLHVRVMQVAQWLSIVATRQRQGLAALPQDRVDAADVAPTEGRHQPFASIGVEHDY